MVPDVSNGMVLSRLMRLGNLTSYAMVEDMAMINSFALMIRWDIVDHSHVFGWNVAAKTEKREELSSEGDDSII